MDAAQLLRTARQESRLSLRELAVRAGTSHSTLAAYEAGRVDPGYETVRRIVDAAGRAVVTYLEVMVEPDESRGRELVEALELAAQFPARHVATLAAPVFGRVG